MKNILISFVVGCLTTLGVMMLIDNEQSKRYEENIKRLKQEKKEAINEMNIIKDSIKKLEESFPIEEKKDFVEKSLDKIKSNEGKEKMVHDDVYTADESVLDSTIRAYRYPTGN